MRKLSLLFVLILTAVMMMAGCGGKNESDEVPQGNDATETDNSVLEKVEKDKDQARSIISAVVVLSGLGALPRPLVN